MHCGYFVHQWGDGRIDRVAIGGTAIQIRLSLFIDHISKLKRDRVIKKFQKAAKRSGEGSHVL